jgi:hypothetical protein
MKEGIPMAFPSGSERRKSERFLRGSWTSARVTTTQGEEREVLAVFNLSFGGVRLVLRDPIDQNAVAGIRLSHSLRDFACQVPVHVVYTEKYSNGHTILGGAFTRELRAAEIQELV